MKIPKKLKIGAHIYEVRIVRGGEHITLSDAGRTCTTKKHVIELDGDLAQTELEATMLHEIFHALNAQWNVNDTMHALMEATAQQLYQVLKDNKLLH